MESKYRLENILDNQSKIQISPARISAYEILLKIEKDKAFSSVLLPSYEENLQAIDRGLCHEIVLGVLRRKLYLAKIIEQYFKKKLDAEVRISLEIGLYQILFLDKIPIYSAINESVNLVRRAKKNSAKGLVNAILRKVSREVPTLEFADEIERISIETSHPRWLLEKWISQFGFESAEKIALANNETPKTTFRFTAKTTDAVKKSIENDDMANRREFLRELAENGKLYFQDEASQLVASSLQLKPEEKFLDICAAPGSKFTQVASSKSHFAGDFYENRLRIMKKSAKQQGLLNINLVAFDATKSLPFELESFDVLLLDSPCSGTGTIRHNPEIRYNLNENDFNKLKKKQLDLLTNASKYLKRGGRIVYSTCSLETEENEDVIENFLAVNNQFEKTVPKVPKEFVTESNFARTFTYRDDVDGFFIAELIRQ
jgi:16S rRNA (cytosine967-C5)-methyltransferase